MFLRQLAEQTSRLPRIRFLLGDCNFVATGDVRERRTEGVDNEDASLSSVLDESVEDCAELHQHEKGMAPSYTRDRRGINFQPT